MTAYSVKQEITQYLSVGNRTPSPHFLQHWHQLPGVPLSYLILQCSPRIPASLYSSQVLLLNMSCFSLLPPFFYFPLIVCSAISHPPTHLPVHPSKLSLILPSTRKPPYLLRTPCSEIPDALGRLHIFGPL